MYFINYFPKVFENEHLYVLHTIENWKFRVIHSLHHLWDLERLFKFFTLFLTFCIETPDNGLFKKEIYSV
jgi:hypothetical protein